MVARTQDVLGEIPLWHGIEQRLYWVDLLTPALHCLDPKTGNVQTVTPPEKLGGYAIRRSGGFVVAGRSGVFGWDPAAGHTFPFGSPEADRPRNIMNDGRCDRAGRFLFGSMDRMVDGPHGRLWSLDAGRGIALLQDGDILVPNALCWSPDGDTLYFGDSRHERIFSYRYDAADGRISERRLFADTSSLPGVLDGSSIDAEGFMWHARFGGGAIVRFDPDGRVEQVIDLPLTQPTHLTFGGPDLRTLYVTTARFRLPQGQLERTPDAGSVLALDVGVSGLEEAFYAG